jgi:hypothetical protein
MTNAFVAAGLASALVFGIAGPAAAQDRGGRGYQNQGQGYNQGYRGNDGRGGYGNRGYEGRGYDNRNQGYRGNDGRGYNYGGRGYNNGARNVYYAPQRNIYVAPRGYYGARNVYRPVGVRGGFYQPGFYGRPVIVPVGGYYGGPIGYGGPVYGGGWGGGWGGPVGYGGPVYGGPVGYAQPVGYYGNQGFDPCRSSGAGAVIGAIAGGVIGNGFAGYRDRGLGTVIGAGLGAVTGTAIERNSRCGY